MITIQGSYPYPANADAGPILTLASNLARMANGLEQGSNQLVGTVTTAQSSWTGQAAEAFANHLTKRASTVQSVAQTIASAAAPLQTFAAAIQSTSAAYTAAVIAERAAEASIIGNAGASEAAVAAEMAAVFALEAAGLACAGALAVIEAKVAAAELAGIGSHAQATPQPTPTPQPQPAPTPTPTPQVQSMIDPWSAYLSTAGENIATDKRNVYEPFVGGIEGYERGLEYAIENNSQAYRRGGNSLLRWTIAGKGTALGMTRAQAVARAANIARWTRFAPAVGATIDGVAQTMEDANNTSLTTGNRVARTTATVAIDGAGAWAGAVAGASVGAEVGALVGVWFGGVGAAPGAAIGSAIGGAAGAFGGSTLGHHLKEELFKWNPGGLFE